MITFTTESYHIVQALEDEADAWLSDNAIAHRKKPDRFCISDAQWAYEPEKMQEIVKQYKYPLPRTGDACTYANPPTYIFSNDNDAIQFKLKFSEHLKVAVEKQDAATISGKE